MVRSIGHRRDSRNGSAVPSMGLALCVASVALHRRRRGVVSRPHHPPPGRRARYRTRMSIGLAILTLLLVAAFIVGAWLAIAGLRGRPIAGVTECAACGFAIVGIDRAGMCPECGRSLDGPRATRPRRTRRCRLVLPGLALVLLAILPVTAFGLRMAAGARLTQLAPVWWLRLELPFVDPARSAEIGGELDIRLTGSQRSMTTAEAQSAADDLSSILSDPTGTWNPGWSDFYERARTQGLVSDEQWMRYVERNLNVGLHTRERVRSGSKLPLQLSLSGARLGQLPVLMVQVRCELGRVTVGGREVADQSGVTWSGALSRSGSSGWTSTVPVNAPPGPAEVVAHYRFDVLTADGQDRVVGTFTRELRTNLEIVGADEPAVTVINDETMASAIRGSLELRELSQRPDGHVSFHVHATNAPVDLAFRVILRPRDGSLAGRECDLGTIHFAAMTTAGYGGDAEIATRDAISIDLLLRPSIEAAEAAPTLRSVWMGQDIVFEGLPLQR